MHNTEIHHMEYSLPIVFAMDGRDTYGYPEQRIRFSVA